MSKTRFDANMSIWLKGREYECQHNLNGDIIVNAKGKPDIYAAIDTEKMNIEYFINYPAPVTNAAVDMIALEDLRYFVELLTEGN